MPRTTEESFNVRPEEKALALEFSVDDFKSKKQSNNDINDVFIVEIMNYPHLFTNNLNQLDVLRNILIPSLSNSYLNNDSLTALANSILMYIRKRGSYFVELLREDANVQRQQAEIHNSNSIFPNEIISNSQFNALSKNKGKNNINLKKIHKITDVNSFILYVNNYIPLPLKFTKKFTDPASLKKTNRKILGFLNDFSKIDIDCNTYSNYMDFLYSTFIWSVSIGNITFLIKILIQCFSLAMNESKILNLKPEKPKLQRSSSKSDKIEKSHKGSKSIKAVKVDQEFLSSLRSDPPFFFYLLFSDSRRGYIECSEFLPRLINHQKSILAVINEDIFVMTSISALTKISLSSSNMKSIDRSQRFSSLKIPLTQNRTPPLLVISNNLLYVGTDNPQIYNIRPFVLLCGNPSYNPKNAPIIKYPATSDGMFIYSLLSKTEIGVYILDGPRINYIRSVKLKAGKSNLLMPYNKKLIAKHWIKNGAAVFTDGIAFRIIIPEGEPGRAQHFIRSFSLIDGSHIIDQKIVFQYYINSITYDPYSNSYYVIAPHYEGAQILQFDNLGPKPSWLGGLKLNYNTSFLKIFDSSIIRPGILYSQIMHILHTLIISSFGCDPNFLPSFINSNNQSTSNMTISSKNNDINEESPEHNNGADDNNNQIKSNSSLNDSKGANMNFFNSNSLFNYYGSYIFNNSLNSYINSIEFLISKCYQNQDKQPLFEIILYAIKEMNSFNENNVEISIDNVIITQKLLLSLLNLIITSENTFLERKKATTIISFLSNLLQEENIKISGSSLRETIFYIFISNYDKLFRSCSELIPDFFELFLINISTHELSLVIQLINQPGKSDLFPYLFSEKTLSNFYSTKLQQLRKTNTPNHIEMEFLMLYQASLFTKLSIDLSKKSSDSSSNILQICCKLSSIMIEQMVLLLQELLNKSNADSIDDNAVMSNSFIGLYRRFLLFIQPNVSNFFLSKSLIKHLYPLMESFSDCMMKLNLLDPSSQFFICFTESFEICISCLIGMIKGSSDLSKASRFKCTIKLLIFTIFKNNYKDTIQTNTTIELKELIQSYDQSLHTINLQELIRFYYTIYKNPFNKTITNEQMEFEAIVLLTISKIFQTDILTFYQNGSSSDTDSKKIKHIMQGIYKIRTNLKMSKQQTAQLNEESIANSHQQYQLYYSHIKEKLSFIISLANFDLMQNKKYKKLLNSFQNEIFDFLLSEMNLEDFISLTSAVKSSCSTVKESFILFQNILKIKNFPIHFYSSLFHRISNDSSILETINILSLFAKTDELQKPCLQLVNYISSLRLAIPLNTFLSFSSLLILIISWNKHSSKSIYSSIYSLFECVCKNNPYLHNDSKANKNPNESVSLIQNHERNIQLFNVCFTFLCYYFRTLFDNKLIKFEKKNVEKIENLFQLIPNESAFSFIIGHSIIHAGFKPIQPFDNILAIMDFVDVNEFHSYCLLLYEYMIKTTDISSSDILILLDKIGLILTGCNCSLLNDYIPVKQLGLPRTTTQNNNSDNELIRTPEAQIIACTELITLFRRILLTKSSTSSKICSIFIEIMQQYINFGQKRTETKNQGIDEESRILRIIAVCSIISNTIHTISPYSFVKNILNQQKYFIREIFFSHNFNQISFSGILLPVDSELNDTVISINNSDVEAQNFLTFIPSMFNDLNSEMNLYYYMLNMKRETYFDYLCSFFILNCLRERIYDSEYGPKFTHVFLQNMKLSQNICLFGDNFDGFEYRSMISIILLLLKKMLFNPSKGIFTQSISDLSSNIIHFYPVSFSKINSYDYSITNSSINTGKGASFVFMTNLIPRSLNRFSKKKISFVLNLAGQQQPFMSFGLVTHSLEKTQTTSIIYNTTENSLKVNGETEFVLENQKQTLEFKFDSETKTLLFGSSLMDYPLFQTKINNDFFSYLIILPPNSNIEYYIGSESQISCFNDDIPNDLSLSISQEGESQFLDKNNGYHYDIVNNKYEIEETTTYYEIKQEIINSAGKDSVLQPMVGSNDKITNFVTYHNLQLNVSNINLKTDTDLFYESFNIPNIWNTQSILRLNYKIFEYDGSYDLIPLDKSIVNPLLPNFNNSMNSSIECKMKPIRYIPSFSCNDLEEMPIDIINSYISGYSELHRHEIITQLTVKSLSNQHISLNQIYNFFSLDLFHIYRLVIDILVLLEPINISNIKEGRSPIDFGVDSTKFGCTKASLFDYHEALTSLFKKLAESNQSKEFFELWLNNLKADFDNGSMHMIKKQNTGAIILKANIPQDFTNKDALGWFVVPLEFGLRKFPNITIANKVFPKDNLIQESSDTNNEKENILEESEPVTYAFIEGQTIHITETTLDSNLSKSRLLLAFIPFLQNSNCTLLNSFIELVINFKYFVLYLNEIMKNLSKEEILNAKIEIRKHVFNSIINGSPFFYSHDDAVLKFIGQKLPINVSDFTQSYIKILNIFSLASQTIPHSIISDFIQEQSLLFDDHKSEAYKVFFPEFSDQPDLASTHKIDPEMKFSLPPFSLPQILSRDPLTRAALLSVRRVLQPRESILNFPFHILINEWAIYYTLFPPADVRIETPSSISIKFIRYVPQYAIILDRDAELIDLSIEFSYSPLFSQSYSSSLMKPIPLSGDKLFIKFKITEDVSQHNFVVASTFNFPQNPDQPRLSISRLLLQSFQMIISQQKVQEIQTQQETEKIQGRIPIDLEEIVRNSREMFISDMKEMILNWSKRDDQMILVHVRPEIFFRNNIRPMIDPLELASIDSNQRTHLIALRCHLLISFNWLCAQFPEVAKGESFIPCRQLISLLMSVKQFHTAIEERSNNNYANLRINRKIGLEVRSGVSKNLDLSMIAQFSQQYRRPDNFRSIQRPFHVEYIGENGIDVGGLARDFASELAKDINEFRVGLFVLTPNAKNKIGLYRDCLIPSPDPHIHDPFKMYRAFGAFIAIGIRSKIVQPFNFPPFFWHYLAGEPITIEQIYEVDEIYRKTIKSLTDSLQLEKEGKISEADFNRSFKLKTIVSNFRGEDIRLGCVSGEPPSVTLQNCQRYIALSQEFRINELTKPMRAIADGFWENLSFRPPPYVTPELLEFLACGERQVDLRQLRSVTQFVGVPKNEITQFWAALGRMNNEQRRNFLQFATGNMCIPQNAGASFLSIVHVDAPVDSKLPSSSTCFYRVHLPSYSSVEKTYKAIMMGVEYSGTFENS